MQSELVNALNYEVELQVQVVAYEVKIIARGKFFRFDGEFHSFSRLPAVDDFTV